MIRPSRLFLADHLLRDGVGHHLGYNLALADASVRVGVPACLVTHAAFDPGLADGIPCHRIFRTDYRSAPLPWIGNRHRLLSILERWCSNRFGADLKRFPVVAASDAVFAQMLAPRHFLHWLRWMAQLAAPPVLFLHLGYRPGRFATPEIAAGLEAILRDLGKRSGRLILVTDSEKLVGPFEKILGRPVHHLPHAISFEIPKPMPQQAANPVVVFVPGNARREKGFAEIVQAMDTLREAGAADAYRFVLQCNDPDRVCAEVLRKGVPSGNGIEWIGRPLSNAEYIERLLCADVILLPYHLDHYELRTSGIFCEARVAGKPVIATNNSWAGDRVHREGGGWLVDEKDVAGLVRVLRSTPGEISGKSAEALALSDSTRSEFHRDVFVRRLMELFTCVSRDLS